MDMMLEWSCWCWKSWEDEESCNHETPLPFTLPSPLPHWPADAGFAKGSITLGELEVVQISNFEKVWACYEGGKNDKGVACYKPVDLPKGFFSLGHYAQPNSSALYGWVLAVKDCEVSRASFDNNHHKMKAPDFPLLSTEMVKKDAKSRPASAKPINYTLVWGSDSWNGDQEGYGFFWLPFPPEGYKALGFVVTRTLKKPSVEEIRCVREDLTDSCEANDSIWSTDDSRSKFPFSVWSTRPCERGLQGRGVAVGTYYCNSCLDAEDSLAVSCLKNVDFDLSSMPTLSQVHRLIQHYGPTVYFHPDEIYFPSSVNWFFESGALLCEKDTQCAIAIAKDGSNLPGGGCNDGMFWLDLPDDNHYAESIKRGNLQSAEVYVHVKPMLGGTFTDIAMWVFCPFNGPSTAKIGRLNFPLGKIGEHISDWEHFTLRISNFTGQLWKIYFSQHSGGEWVNAADLEYIDGNKAIVYSSKYGHASFPHPGDFLQGDAKLGVGLRNDAAKSAFSLDTSSRYQVVAAEYMKSVGVADFSVEPDWLQYMREWGPTIVYDSRADLNKLIRFLPSTLKHALENIFNKLPNELGGEEGPTGPKEKDNWKGDERS